MSQKTECRSPCETFIYWDPQVYSNTRLIFCTFIVSPKTLKQVVVRCSASINSATTVQPFVYTHYCDRLGCHVLCLPHGISVWQGKRSHCYKKAQSHYNLRCVKKQS